MTGRFINQRVAPVRWSPTRSCGPRRGDGGLTARVPCQAPFWEGDFVSRLGLEKDAVRVIAPAVGGGFGAKVGTYPEQFVVAALAVRLGRPVRTIETRSENMVAMTHGRAQVQDVQLGATRDGRITGLKLRVVQDCGAYPQGVCWFELASVHDAAALPGAIAAALGVQGGPGEPLPQLIAALTPLTMLLAVDNAEHLLADVARVCHALPAASPALRIVVTSQAPLKIAAERVVRIEPLCVPEAAAPALQANQFGAIALFVERVQAIDARFALTDANAPAVIELCRALDGLPLAIELAAARAPLLGVPHLLASMRERLQLPAPTATRAAPTRQRTLRAALEWSHGFLQPLEARVFRRLGVMAASASLEFIQQVVADARDESELDAWAVLDALDALVDRSLVAVLGPAGAPDGAPRYRLLETPRAYALERLEEAGEREAVGRRHALATATLCNVTYDSYFDGCIGADDWLLRFAPDLDNARDALAWARAAGDASTELTIAATVLRALPPSLHSERMALADACDVRLAAATVSESLRQRICIELSCAWADTQKLRARDAAQRALDLARRLERGPELSNDRFMLITRCAVRPAHWPRRAIRPPRAHH